MSTGAKEPRKIFELVDDRLVLGLDDGLTKQELARAIVEASGSAWHPDYDSRGGTVTKDGLWAVRKAVAFFGLDGQSCRLRSWTRGKEVSEPTRLRRHVAPSANRRSAGFHSGSSCIQ